MSHRLAATVLALLAFATTPGCCSLARLFCGPDKSPWVRVAFATPDETLRTFLEAIRRDDPDRVYECLAEDYKHSMGLDQMVTSILWERIRAEAPGYHLVGYAKPGDPVRQPDGTVTFMLDAEGHQLRVDLVRQAFWEVAFRTPKGLLMEKGEYVTTLNPYAKCEPDKNDDSQSRLSVTLQFRHGDVESVPLTDIERAGIGREWKVCGFREVTGQ